MDIKQFKKIMCDSEIKGISSPIDDLNGLIIINKYLPRISICGAMHDVIYSCDIFELTAAGITEGDARALKKLGWFIDSDDLAHFVGILLWP